VVERSERAATLRSRSRSLPLELTRRVAVDDGAVRLDYELRNLGDDELAFLWAAHPQFRCAPGTRVRLPEHVRAVVNAQQDRHGDRGSLIGWPAHDGFELDRIGPVHLGTCRKLYVPPDVRVAEASLNGPDSRQLTVRWESDELPYLGVWIDEGRYSREPVCALEPATAFFDSLAEAVDHARAATIPAGGVRTWTLAVSS
jgi:galactose mutarotase-like enzyme